MIPIEDNAYLESIEDTEETQSSKTFKLDFENRVIGGSLSGLEAIVQAVYCMLNTERYAHLIYSFDYGILTSKYIGQDLEYIKGDLPKEIEETLLQDDRVLSVHSFFIEQVGVDSVEIAFVVETIDGDISMRKEVGV